jgi:nicotinamidase-related amidase
MRKIHLPKSNRTKALILVDFQKGFMKYRKKIVVKNLELLLKYTSYTLYIDTTFHAEKGSLWDKQTKWTFPYQPTIPEVKKLLKGKVVSIIKETRSAFKGNKDLKKILRKHKVTEVHIVGFDSNDCIFATAQESFDLGFYTYVIEECTGASNGVKIHNSAITILRNLGLTNHIK